MSAEAFARLRNPRMAVRTGLADGEPPETHAMVRPEDLRALLDAVDAAHDFALRVAETNTGRDTLRREALAVLAKAGRR